MPKINDIDNKLVNVEQGGLVFITDFPEYDKSYVSRKLAAKTSSGDFVKLGNGIFCKPIMTQYGPLYPSVDKVVDAISRRDNAKILPSGAVAMNKLGLSTQVPMKMVYVTNGSARDVVIDGRTIKFKRVTPKQFEFDNEVFALLNQALKSIGKDNVSMQQKSQIKGLINAAEIDSRSYAHDLGLMALWMRQLITELSN